MFRQLAPTIAKVALFWAATMAVLAICGVFAKHSSNPLLVTGAIAAPATFGLTWIFVSG